MKIQGLINSVAKHITLTVHGTEKSVGIVIFTLLIKSAYGHRSKEDRAY